ncbi:CBK1 kinase activator protein MOB2 [Choanephora cucurbitarum]|uniref:CBK1 kinase activator protein MOB2 n=1 Tax=Choanephora cucurbitarum TaxID=101091 RepID=A0A1C7NQ19_9FUNG|nr:CBK1 kinase activator protein MOB2 [Choanephora cucurbitarum]
MMNFLGFSFGKKSSKSSKKSAGSSASSIHSHHANHSSSQLSSKSLCLCSPYVNNMLVKGNFKMITELPKYVDINEWLAFNTFEFFNHINLFYGSITNFCTPQSCPTMSAGSGVEYTWSDSTSKKVRLPASQYIDYMTSSIESMLNDESLFPTKSGPEFPRELHSIVKKMFGQMFRLFAHIYHEHFDKVLCLNEEPHFNSLFAHFISFAREFDLLEKQEMQPLSELINIMLKNGVIC